MIMQFQLFAVHAAREEHREAEDVDILEHQNEHFGTD
jgi:hypothetical protein